MNILMALSQQEVTGAEVYATALSDMLIEKGHSVWILSDTLTKPTRATYKPFPFTKRSFFDRIRNVAAIVRFIKEHNIDIVHAHSRASGWAAFFAARIARVPIVTTVHGRQPVHFSRRLVHAFGERIFAVCENIHEHLKRDLGVPPRKITTLRNGIPPEFFTQCEKPGGSGHVVPSTAKTVAIIGRLSGTKGEVAFSLLEILCRATEGWRIVVIGGKTVPERFDQFRGQAEFVGYTQDPTAWMRAAALVIGSGRVAMEALMLGAPTFAIGEATAHGLITPENLAQAMTSNFGDIAEREGQFFDWRIIKGELLSALENPVRPTIALQEFVRQEYSLPKILAQIEATYQSVLVNFHRKEIPILLYHRVVRTPQEAGRHGIYVTVAEFEAQLALLQKKGFETVTFAELFIVNRFDKRKKYAVLTFDDGYEDNYTLAFPLLKKYGAKAVIYLLTNRETNTWDAAAGSEPVVPLLKAEQIAEMQRYGIEFGSHGTTHADLTTLSPDESQREITESKKELERRLGKQVISFAFPYGRLTEKLKRDVQAAGYRYGIATDTGPIALHEDFFQVRRIIIFPNMSGWHFARKIAGNYTFKRLARSGG